MRKSEWSWNATSTQVLLRKLIAFFNVLLQQMSEGTKTIAEPVLQD